jgi:gliding motility-associated lipoprotein GldH
MKKVFRILSVLLLVVAAASCDSSIYNKMKEIPDSKWDMNYPVKFDVDIADTTTLFDFFVLLRHNTDYAYNNVYSFEFQQAMRDTILNGVSDIGIKIKPTPL